MRNILNIKYDKDNRYHNMLFASIVFILVLIAVMIPSPPRQTVEYPAYKVEYLDQYGKQFDAFKKGQLHIDIVPDRVLEGLQNPYDPNERMAWGAEYLWDHAYYNGKYYSYFGIAPIFTVYYPFYFVTRSLPSSSMACLILAVYAIIFISLAHREFAIRFAKNANLISLLLSLICTVCASGVYLGVLCSDVYYVAVLSALGLVFSCVFFMFRGMREERPVLRGILFFLSGVSVVLAVLSRPTASLLCLAVAPLFIDYVLKIRKNNLKEGIATSLSFVLPVVIGAVFVMLFNNARFGSPFDFGANYQLTINDISENVIEFDFLLPALFSFFINPFTFKKAFPFVEMNMNLHLPEGARYVYCHYYIGAFSHVLPLGLLFAPRLFFIDRKKKESDKVKIATVALVFVICIIVAFADFCLAGVNMRYIYDITPMLSAAGAFILLDLQSKTKGAERVAVTLLSSLIFILTIFSCINVVVSISKIL